jgi:hypothetical protein
VQYLRIRKGKRARTDGFRWAETLVIHKTCKFGTVIEEKSLSVKRPVLITGPHDAGKTHWLERLHKETSAIWETKSKTPSCGLAAARRVRLSHD